MVIRIKIINCLLKRIEWHFFFSVNINKSEQGAHRAKYFINNKRKM